MSSDRFVGVIVGFIVAFAGILLIEWYTTPQYTIKTVLCRDYDNCEWLPRDDGECYAEDAPHGGHWYLGLENTMPQEEPPR